MQMFNRQWIALKALPGWAGYIIEKEKTNIHNNKNYKQCYTPQVQPLMNDSKTTVSIPGLDEKHPGEHNSSMWVVPVRVGPSMSSILISVSEYYWGVAASKFFCIDPVEALYAVMFTQRYPSSTYPLRAELRTAVYQWLVWFSTRRLIR